MAIILNIDSSGEKATVSIAEDGKIFGTMSNDVQKEHATFLHCAINELIRKTGIGFKALDAVAVTEGPGSYTGLRVGMATAKGLSFALNIPFITIGTLPAMLQAYVYEKELTNGLFMPMIDARRMEVFTAVYESNLEEIVSPCAMILNDTSFENFFAGRQIFLFGSGAEKCKGLSTDARTHFDLLPDLAKSLCFIANEKYKIKEFSTLSNSQPLYIKEFFNG